MHYFDILLKRCSSVTKYFEHSVIVDICFLTVDLVNGVAVPCFSDPVSQSVLTRDISTGNSNSRNVLIDI